MTEKNRIVYETLMKVKNVTIPIKIDKNEDKIIQLKFFIILNIPNKR